MQDNKEVKQYIKREASKEIILKHIFIQTLEARYGDEYIEAMYRIRPVQIRNSYEALNEDEKIEIEEELKRQIESGDIDIKQSAVEWHRESLRREHIRKINKENRNKQGKER